MPTLYLNLFVYGTLMRGGANHAVLERLGARFESEAMTRDPRTLVDLGPYPALLKLTPPFSSSKAPARVAGELWRVPSEAYEELDAFEGCPDLFARDTVALVLIEDDAATHEIETAMVYVLATTPPPHAQILVPSEDGKPTRYMHRGEELPDGAKPEQIAPKC